MWYDFWYAIWFFIPAGAANITPVLVTRVPGLKTWNTPLDGGRHYRGQRLLGASKTWRGLICGVVMAVLVLWLQKGLSMHLGSFTTYLIAAHYTTLSLWLGVLLGGGALSGDALKSFFKRQAGIAPGRSWFPFDQLDYIIGACLCSAVIVRLPLRIYLWIAVVGFVLHLIFSYLGYLLHLKKAPL